jgi:hypothetical protein
MPPLQCGEPVTSRNGLIGIEHDLEPLERIVGERAPDARYAVLERVQNGAARPRVLAALDLDHEVRAAERVIVGLGLGVALQARDRVGETRLIGARLDAFSSIARRLRLVVAVEDDASRA